MEKQIDVKKKQLKTEFPYLCFEGCFALCGQPQAQDLEEFKEDSWTHVINLRSAQELETLDFNLSESCQNLGLKYRHIPVIVNGDIDKEALKQIHDLLSNKEKNNKYVIHCASGARSVLAVLAHLLFSKRWAVEDLPVVAGMFDFQQMNMLNRLAQIMSLEN